MALTRDMIIKNMGVGTMDSIYIQFDGNNPNMAFLLSHNNLMGYAGIDVFIYDEVLQVLTIYSYFYHQNMKQFDEAVDFWNDMSDKERLAYLFNMIPWQIEECDFKQVIIKE